MLPEAILAGAIIIAMGRLAEEPPIIARRAYNDISFKAYYHYFYYLAF